MKHHSMSLGIEADQAVIREVRRAVVFPTHSKVQSEPGIHLEIILDVQILAANVVEVRVAIDVGLIPSLTEEKVCRVGARVRRRAVFAAGNRCRI